MTHEYTLLVGGHVIPGDGRPDTTAIAWAGDTLLAIGDDEEVQRISRGDSHLHVLAGAWVTGPSGTLEIGGPADLDVIDDDPRAAGARPTLVLARVRGGRVVAGTLPGGMGHADHADHAGGESGPSGVPPIG